MWVLGSAFLSSPAAAALLLWCTGDGPVAAAVSAPNPPPAVVVPAGAPAPAPNEPRSKLVRPLVLSGSRVSDGRDLQGEAGQSFRKLTEDDVQGGGDGAKAATGTGGAAAGQTAGAGTDDGKPAVVEVNVSRAL